MKLKMENQKMNLLTDLPEPIIHHILSFLPTKDATRICVVSKRLLSAFHSFPIIVFDEKNFWNEGSKFKRTHNMLRLLKQFLLRRSNFLHFMNLHKFVLRVTIGKKKFSEDLVNFAVAYVLENNVKDLELNFDPRDAVNIEERAVLFKFMPRRLLSARWVRVLTLKRVKFDIEIADFTFPFLKELSVNNCKGPATLKISVARLASLELNDVFGSEKFKIEASCLESFTFIINDQRNYSSSGEIEIKGCRLLKHLRLHGANVTDQWFEDNVSKFPFLESLTLSSCNLLQKINLSINHERLKNFQLIGCVSFQEAEIHARNLGSFTFSGNLIPSTLLIYSPFLYANLIFETNKKEPMVERFERVREFLACFNHCKGLRLVCQSELLMISEELKESLLPPLFDIKLLKIETNTSTTENLIMLVDSLLWFSPLLETLTIIDDETEMSLKFQHDMESVSEEDDQVCCRHRIIKCWKHYLDNVIMDNFSHHEEELLSNFFENNAIRLPSISTGRTSSRPEKDTSFQSMVFSFA